MHSLILPFCIIAVVFIAVTALRRAMAMRAEAAALAKPAYVRRKSLLSAAERTFAATLETVLPEELRLMCKVRLGDIVQPRTGLSTGERATAWNRLNQKCVDFLVVRTSDFTPVAAVELDDDAAAEGPRQAREQFLAEVCRVSGLPLLRFPASEVYSPSELRQKIVAAVAPPARG